MFPETESSYTHKSAVSSLLNNDCTFEPHVYRMPCPPAVSTQDASVSNCLLKVIGVNTPCSDINLFSVSCK